MLLLIVYTIRAMSESLETHNLILIREVVLSHLIHKYR